MKKLSNWLAGQNGAFLMGEGVIYGFAPSTRRTAKTASLLALGRRLKLAAVPGDAMARAVGCPAGTVGFELDLAALGAAKGRKPSALLAGVRPVVAFAGSPYRDREVEHAIDGIRDGIVSGWAFDPSATDRPLEIEICLDGAPIARSTAGTFRFDLLQAGKADGACGFRTAVHAALEAAAAGPRPRWLSLRRLGMQRPFAVRPVLPTFEGLRLQLGDAPSARALEGRLTRWADPVAAACVHVVLGADVHQVRTDATGGFSVSDATRIGRTLSRKEDQTQYEIRYLGRQLAHGGIEPGRIRPGRMKPGHIKPGHIKPESASALNEPGAPRPAIRVDSIANGVIAGYTSGFAGDAVPAIDVEIDGTSIATLIPSRPAATPPANSETLHRFEMTLAADWLDGREHDVRLRALGSCNIEPCEHKSVVFGAAQKAWAVRLAWTSPHVLEGRLAAVGNRPIRPERLELEAEGHALATADIMEVTPPGGLFPPRTPIYGFRFDARGTLAKTANHLEIAITSELGRMRAGPAHRWPVPRPEPAGEAALLPVYRSWSLQAGSRLCVVLPTDTLGTCGRESANELCTLATEAAAAGENVVVACLPGMGPVAQRFLIQSLRWLGLGEPPVGLRIEEMIPWPLPVSCHPEFEAPVVLDFWARAADVRAILVPLTGGLASAAVDTKHQGLGFRNTQLWSWLDGSTLSRAVAQARVPDGERGLHADALERRVLRRCDAALAPSQDRSARLSTFGLPAPPRLELISLPPPAHVGRAAEVTTQDVEPRPRGDGACRVFVVGAEAERATRLSLDKALAPLAKAARARDLRVSLIGLGPCPGASHPLAEEDSAGPHLDFTRIGPDGAAATQSLANAQEQDFALILPACCGTLWHRLVEAHGLTSFRLSGCEASQAPPPADIIAAVIQGIDRAAKIKIAQSRVPAARSEPTGHSAASLPIDGNPAEGANKKQIKALLDAPVVGTVEAASPRPGEALISVCISHYRRPALLWQTLRSLTALEGTRTPPIEIIVVDDGSAHPGVLAELDDVETWLAKHGGQLVHQTNRYLGAARNTAWRRARGDLILFMDDDNLARPDLISTLADVQARTGADAVTSLFYLFESNALIHPDRTCPASLNAPSGPDLALGTLFNCFGDANMLIRRAMLEKIGGFTEDYGRGHEDWELFTRIAAEGGRIERVMLPLFWYRIASDSMIRGGADPTADLLRNLRALNAGGRPDLYRLALLAHSLKEHDGG